MTCEIEREGRLAASVGAVDVGAIHLGGAEAAVTGRDRERERITGGLCVYLAEGPGLHRATR